MSVPAINSLPPSGNQASKINSSTTANPSVTPLGLSVSPKLSVIPSQIPANQTKSPSAVNHSAIPLSLVFENKVSGSQGQTAVTKSSPEKPKDSLAPKPTPNGVEAATKSPPAPSPAQPAPTPATATPPSASKSEETTAQPQTNTNHSEKSTDGSSELSTAKEVTAASAALPPTNMTTDNKIEQSSSQTSPVEDEKKDSKTDNEAPAQSAFTKEEPATEAKGQETVPAKSSTQSNKRKREQKMPGTKEEESSSAEPEKKPRRIRSQVLPYQSPLPELATFISKSLKEKDAMQKNNEEKLIVFYRNEFLAVRNAEGGFYLCQTLQNVYRSSHRIRIRWLSQDKEKSNEEGDIYTPDFYDLTDFECILTTVALNKTDKNMYKLQKVELERIENILKRALDVEKGVTEKPSITEEHPDGIDLSLYKDESQLQKPKKSSKRAASSPLRRSPKQTKKEHPGEVEKTPKKTAAKAPARNAKPAKKLAKNVDKSKAKKKGSGKSESKPSKAVDQLKVSPPNEKARVVAKVLRKVDIVSAKDVSIKKQAKSKAAKRGQETSLKSQKKPLKGGTKKVRVKGGGKEESSSTQHNYEKRQANKSKQANQLGKTKKN